MLPYTIPKLKHVDVNGRFFLLAGPCAIESKEMAMEIAERIKGISDKYHIPFIFKGSYRKANKMKKYNRDQTELELQLLTHSLFNNSIHSSLTGCKIPSLITPSTLLTLVALPGFRLF